MIYETLRDLILDNLRYIATFDDIGITGEVRPYIERIRNGENISKVVREYAAKVTKDRTWTARVDDKTYRINANSTFRGKVGSPFKNKSGEPHIRLATQILICLANINQVLAKGEKTRFVPADGHKDKSGNIKHPGSNWIYAKEHISESGLEGDVIVHILFNKSQGEAQKESPAGNHIYHISTEGLGNFSEKSGYFRTNNALRCEVEIVMDE